MLKHYVEFIHPGFFVSETTREEVPERTIEHVRLKKGSNAFAFRFFDQEEVVNCSEVLKGDPKNWSELTFIGGKVYSYEEVLREFPNEKTLQSNMRINKMDYVIKTRAGNFTEFKKQHTIVSEDAVTDISHKKLRFR